MTRECGTCSHEGESIVEYPCNRCRKANGLMFWEAKEE